MSSNRGTGGSQRKGTGGAPDKPPGNVLSFLVSCLTQQTT